MTGESGAAGLAGVVAHAADLGLRDTDDVLVVSAEGATDPVAHAAIVGAEADAAAISRCGARAASGAAWRRRA